MLTPKEEKILKLAEKGGNDATLLLLDLINKLEDEMEEIKKAHAEMPKTMEMMPKEIAVEVKGAEVVTIKGKQGIQGERGEQGDKGDSGGRGIDGKNGIDGKDGLDGLDGKDGYSPLRGIDYFDGKDGSPDDPNQIRDKLETLEGDERLDASAIKGLEKYDKDIEILKQGRPIFGPGKTKIIQVDLSSQLNGTTKTFSIGFSHFGIVGVYGSSSPFIFRPTVDYIESGINIVFDVTNVDASISLASGQTLIVKVLK